MAQITRTCDSVRRSTIQKPPIIDETIIRETQQVVQPVIHLEVVKTEVRHIRQPIYEEVTRPTQIHEGSLPEDISAYLSQQQQAADSKVEEPITRNDSDMPKIITTYAPPVIKRVVLQPIIYEKIIPQIIEEIQPVIYRTIHETHIVKRQEEIVEGGEQSPSKTTETTTTSTVEEMSFISIQRDMEKVEIKGMSPSV